MLVVLTAGCAVDPATETALYRQVLDGVDAAATQPIDLPPGAPLTVSLALALANRHNERLALEGENYVQALIDKRRAAAAFAPTVSLSPLYAVERVIESTGGPAGPDSSSVLTVPLDVEWNVFNGYRDAANRYRAAATAQQRRALLLDLQSTVLLDVAQTLYQVLRAERSVQVIENSLAVQRQRVDEARKRLRAGVSPPLDVAQSEARAAATASALILARRDATLSRELLELLIGVPSAGRGLRDDFAPPAQAEPLERWQAQAAGRRQDLAAAAHALEAAQHRVQVAFGQYYPSVTLQLGASLSVEEAVTETAWNGVLRAHLPLLEFGRIHADVRTAWSQVRQAQLGLAFAGRQVRQQVASAYHTWISTRQRVEQLRTQLSAAETAFRQADRSWSAGLATNLERLTAQDQLLSAQLEVVSEEFAVKVAYLGLLRAAGALSTRTPLEPPAATRPG